MRWTDHGAPYPTKKYAFSLGHRSRTIPNSSVGVQDGASRATFGLFSLHERPTHSESRVSTSPCTEVSDSRGMKPSFQAWELSQCALIQTRVRSRPVCVCVRVCEWVNARACARVYVSVRLENAVQSAWTDLRRIRSVMGVRYLARAISAINNLIYLLQSWRDWRQVGAAAWQKKERKKKREELKAQCGKKLEGFVCALGDFFFFFPPLQINHPRWHCPVEWSPFRTGQ